MRSEWTVPGADVDAWPETSSRTHHRNEPTMTTYPYKNDAGETVYACCESTIGPTCAHRATCRTCYGVGRVQVRYTQGNQKIVRLRVQ